eukprot:Rmarinus@m.4246
MLKLLILFLFTLGILGNVSDMLEEPRRLFSEGQLDAAVNSVQRIIREDPSNVDAWMLLGGAQVHSSDISGAIESFTEASRLRPEDPSVHFNLGIAYMGTSAEKALNSMRRCLELNPHNPLATMYMALLLIETHEDPPYGFSLYMSVLRTVPPCSPDFHSMARTLADALMDAEMLDETVSCLSEAVDAMESHSCPRYTPIYTQFGIALYRRGRYAEATSQFLIVAEEDKTATAWLNVGLGYSRQKLLLQSADAFDRAISINPDCDTCRDALQQLSLAAMSSVSTTCDPSGVCSDDVSQQLQNLAFRAADESARELWGFVERINELGLPVFAAEWHKHRNTVAQLMEMLGVSYGEETLSVLRSAGLQSLDYLEKLSCDQRCRSICKVIANLKHVRNEFCDPAMVSSDDDLRRKSEICHEWGSDGDRIISRNGHSDSTTHLASNATTQCRGGVHSSDSEKNMKWETMKPDKLVATRPMRFVLHCSVMNERWGPDSLLRGVGGSEEAGVFLTRELQASGLHVDVYAHLLHENSSMIDVTGARWSNLDSFDPLSPADIFVCYRTYSDCVLGLFSTTRALWLQDIVDVDALSPLVASQLDAVVVLCENEKSKLPDYVRDKGVISMNSIDPALFVDSTNEPDRVIYASSPDRGLEQLLDTWPQLRAHVPTLKLDVYYGFTKGFHRAFSQHPWFNGWMEKMQRGLSQEGVTYHGLVDHVTLSDAFARSGFWLYPTTFPETSCITAMKAQAMGAIPITSRYPRSALPDTAGKFDLGPDPMQGEFKENADWIQAWVDRVVDVMTIMPHEHLEAHRKEMKRYARETFIWSNVASQWRDLTTRLLDEKAASGDDEPSRELDQMVYFRHCAL